jgi:hypothetical protein
MNFAFHFGKSEWVCVYVGGGGGGGGGVGF